MLGVFVSVAYIGGYVIFRRLHAFASAFCPALSLSRHKIRVLCRAFPVGFISFSVLLHCLTAVAALPISKIIRQTLIKTSRYISLLKRAR